MKKQVILVAVFLLGIATGSVSATAQTTGRITKTRIVQATKDTTVTYAGVKIFIPQGETVILGQREDGSILIRGQDTNGVRINGAAVSFPGTAILSVNPQNNVITVDKGDQVSVTDANGRTSVLSQGASVSTTDIRTETAPTLSNVQAANEAQKAVTKVQDKVAKTEAKAKAKAEKAAAKAQVSEATQVLTDTANELPAFVAESVASSAASEQAVQNVEETEKTLSDASTR